MFIRIDKTQEIRNEDRKKIRKMIRGRRIETGKVANLCFMYMGRAFHG